MILGGGLWHPEGPAMEKLRDDIDENPHRLRRALMSDGLRRDFFKGSKDEKAVITQFTGMNAESALKTKPKVSLRTRNVCFKVDDNNKATGLRS
jgi:uncharacterized protein (DUF2461 family)